MNIIKKYWLTKRIYKLAKKKILSSIYYEIFMCNMNNIFVFTQLLPSKVNNRCFGIL